MDRKIVFYICGTFIWSIVTILGNIAAIAGIVWISSLIIKSVFG